MTDSLNDEQLSALAQQIEDAIKKKYVRNFAGVSAGVVTAFSIMIYFGMESVEQTLAKKSGSRSLVVEI